ncbi:MAG TPA: DUF167 family protein [Arenicellales bacterium]|nr:DUF167 family protein [Arenicellales bacterium]
MVTAPRPWHRWHGPDLELRIKVQPQSRNEGVADVVGDSLRVRVAAPPVDGKANKRLLQVLAKAFGVARSRVQLVHGAGSRQKWVRIERPERCPQALCSLLDFPPEVEKSGKSV